ERMLYNRKKLLWGISFLLLFAMINCSSSSKQKKEPVTSKPQIQQPLPVMGPQVDSLKKVLDEKRRERK
ncbi:MAG: hypothetical protein WCO54_06690, partial [Bacteroidota bacterium]